MEQWQTTTLAAAKTYHGQIGPLAIYLRRAGSEILLASQRSDDLLALAARPLSPSVEPQPEELEWQRFISRHEPCRVRLTPVMPDRPVVTRPAEPVRLPAGEEAMFYVTIPVWARLEAAQEPPVTLTELPTGVLSNTWFGDPMAGDLCYALRTRARRDRGELQPWPHRVICPFHVANRAPEALDVERICVHVAFLDIYAEKAGRLWTQRVKVEFRGRDRVSELAYDAGPPDAAPDAARLSAARQKYEGQGLLRRSLVSVREVFAL